MQFRVQRPQLAFFPAFRLAEYVVYAGERQEGRILVHQEMFHRFVRRLQNLHSSAGWQYGTGMSRYVTTHHHRQFPSHT